MYSRDGNQASFFVFILALNVHIDYIIQSILLFLFSCCLSLDVLTEKFYFPFFRRYDGQFEDIKLLNELLTKKNAETGWDTPMYVVHLLVHIIQYIRTDFSHTCMYQCIEW